MTIDWTDRNTLVTVKVALIRALNSLDNEIAQANQHLNGATNPVFIGKVIAKMELLKQSRSDMTAIYNDMDEAINAATENDQ